MQTFFHIEHIYKGFSPVCAIICFVRWPSFAEVFFTFNTFLCFFHSMNTHMIIQISIPYKSFFTMNIFLRFFTSMCFDMVCQMVIPCKSFSTLNTLIRIFTTITMHHHMLCQIGILWKGFFQTEQKLYLDSFSPVCNLLCILR